ncbi:hypothetical protein [uncultured Prevotella sp.]|uniref:hypothetical protein n=1 Tax=uncultured Prevotella sp. TaxID=159272 RepID=UPI00258E131B|nr:hypothetical protein [uncultured Prevotella sp.]
MKTVIYNNIKGIVKGILPSCLFIFLPLTVTAQEMKKVSGYVMDAATGKPLAGVIVEAYGNHRFTAMTDETGAYELKVPEYVSSVSMRVEILIRSVLSMSVLQHLYPVVVPKVSRIRLR